LYVKGVTESCVRHRIILILVFPHYRFAETIVFVCQSILQVTVKSIHDPKVGAIFDARSLIQALTILISEQMDMCLSERGHLTENVKVVN
jgi:hypothetical protein